MQIDAYRTKKSLPLCCKHIINLNQNKMKKTLFLLLALMMGSVAMAQDFDFCIGPKIGYQTAKLSYKKADINHDFRNSFTIGLFGRVQIGNLYVQPELLYFRAQNDFSLDFSNQSTSFLGFDPNVSLTLNTMNLQVPIMIGYQVLDLKIAKLRVQAGPTANFVLKDTTLLNAGLDNTTTEAPQFDINKVNWGLQAGIGADVLGFTIDINYNFGLSKVFKPGLIENNPFSNYVGPDNIDKTKQNLFMVTLGYKFL